MKGLSDGRLSAIIDAFMFCLIDLIHEAGRKTSWMNELDFFSGALQVLNISVYLHVLAT